MRTYMHTCIQTCIHTYIHSCIHAYIHTNMHTYIHTHILSAFRGKSVLELGAGCGYVGIAAARMGAVVTVTGRNEEKGVSIILS